MPINNLEKNIREFEASERSAAEERAHNFNKSIAPLLPLALLFCNAIGQDNVDKDQIKALFEGGTVNKYQALNGGVKSLEFIDYLAEFTSRTARANVNDVVVVTNASEAGFDAIRLMNYFEHQFYLTTVEQVNLVNKLGFVLEEDRYFDDYASGVDEKLWEIYDCVRDDLIANGFTPSALRQGYKQLEDIRYRKDSLRLEIAKLIDNLKHI